MSLGTEITFLTAPDEPAPCEECGGVVEPTAPEALCLKCQEAEDDRRADAFYERFYGGEGAEPLLRQQELARRFK